MKKGWGLQKGLVLAVLGLWVTAAQAESEDWQLWSEQGVSGEFNDQWSLKLRQEEKWSDQKGGLTEYNVDAGLTYKASSAVKIGLNYRQSYEKKGDEWFEENRPHLNVTLTRKLEKVTVSNRTRVELRIKANKSDIVRTRNKTSVQCNKGIAGWKPYVADELFADSANGEFNRNRLYFGLKGKPAEKVKTEVYALWQRSDKGSFWEDVVVVGLKAYAVF